MSSLSLNRNARLFMLCFDFLLLVVNENTASRLKSFRFNLAGKVESFVGLNETVLTSS